jgi:hypothetical protein
VSAPSAGGPVLITQICTDGQLDTILPETSAEAVTYDFQEPTLTLYWEDEVYVFTKT